MFMYVAYYSLRNCVVIKLSFRAYLVLSTFCFSILGYQQMLNALSVTFSVRLHHAMLSFLTPPK